MCLLLTSDAELWQLRGLHLVHLHDFPSIKDLHCVDVIYCTKNAVNLAVFVHRHDFDTGFTHCLYLAVFNQNMQPILRKLELAIVCCLEKNRLCIVDSTKLVLVEYKTNKNNITRIFFISLHNYHPNKQCNEFINIPKERSVTGVYKNSHNSSVFIHIFDESNGGYDWIMCAMKNNHRHGAVNVANTNKIFHENRAYEITRSNDSGGSWSKLYDVTAFSDISGMNNTEFHDKLITVITTLKGDLFVYCDEIIVAHLDNIQALKSVHVSISVTCYSISDIYAFIYCCKSGVLLVVSLSLQNSVVKLLLQCNNIKAYQYSSVLTPMYNHLLLLPSSLTSVSTTFVVIDVSKYGSKYCVLGSKMEAWQAAPSTLDAVAILNEDTNSKKHKKSKTHDVAAVAMRDDATTDNVKSKFEIHDINKNTQHMVVTAVQARLEQTKKKILILENLLDGKYVTLISLRNIMRQMLCVLLTNRPVALHCNKRIPAINCNHIIENILKPFQIGPSPVQLCKTSQIVTKAVENDAIINHMTIKDIIYQPIPNSWSVLVLLRVSNASLLPVFNLHASLHLVEPNINVGSGGSHNIRVNSRISTLSGSTAMVNPNDEVWLFAKAELPPTLFTPASVYCALSVSLTWTEIYSTNSKLSTYTSANSDGGSNIAELLEILAKDKYRSSLELSLGWLPRTKQSKSVGLLLLSPKEFIWNVDTRSDYEIHRCKVAPYLLGRKLCAETGKNYEEVMYSLLQQWLKDAEQREVGAIIVNSFIKSVNLVIEGDDTGTVDINQLSCESSLKIPVTYVTAASQRIESILRFMSAIHFPVNHCIKSHLIVYSDNSPVENCNQFYMRLVVNSALYSERLVSMTNTLQSLKSNVIKMLNVNGALTVGSMQLLSASNEYRFNLVRLASLYMLEEMKVLALAYREQKLSSNSLPQESDVVLTVGSKLKIKNNLALGKLLLSRQLQTDTVISLLL